MQQVTQKVIIRKMSHLFNQQPGSTTSILGINSATTSKPQLPKLRTLALSRGSDLRIGVHPSRGVADWSNTSFSKKIEVKQSNHTRMPNHAFFECPIPNLSAPSEADSDAPWHWQFKLWNPQPASIRDQGHTCIIIWIPGRTEVTSIFEAQSWIRRDFPSKTKAIWQGYLHINQNANVTRDSFRVSQSTAAPLPSCRL